MSQLSDSSITVVPGAVLDSSQVTTSVGVVQRERVAIGDSDRGGQVAAVGTDGSLQVGVYSGLIIEQNAQIISLLTDIKMLLADAFETTPPNAEESFGVLKSY